MLDYKRILPDNNIDVGIPSGHSLDVLSEFSVCRPSISPDWLAVKLVHMPTSSTGMTLSAREAELLLELKRTKDASAQEIRKLKEKLEEALQVCGQAASILRPNSSVTSCRFCTSSERSLFRHLD
jgi:hypothetical protein